MPFVDHAGRQVHFEEGAPGPGLPLLMVNGLLASAFLWPARWLEALERGRRVIRISNQGTGHTAAGSEPTIPAMAGDALAVLDALGIERCAVLGFSMGGMIAQRLATDARDRVAALILCSTSGGGSTDVHPEFLDAVGGSGGDTASVSGSFFHLLTGEGFFDRRPDALGDLALGWQQAPTPPETAMLQMTAAAPFDSSTWLADVDVPTLVLHGDDDRLLVADGGRRIAAAIPGAELHVFEGVGHLLPYEVTEESLALIEAHLARLDALSV